MTLPASIALLSAGIALLVAAMSRQFSLAPGWRDQRYFTFAALAVAAYTLLNIPTSARFLSDEAVIICSRLQIAAGALHAWAWLRYTGALVGRRRPGPERLLAAVLIALSVAEISTPFFVSGTGMERHTVEWLGVTYRSPIQLPAGNLAWALMVLLLIVPLMRLARASKSGLPGASVQFLALLVLILMGANDALVAGGAYPGLYLIDLGFLLPLMAVGYSLTARFVGDARTLSSLRGELEKQVADRTAELSRAQESLHRAEKLAALGQFAAGVAHEVNNPSAVVSANLQYLKEAESDALSDSGREAIQEALQSVQRISTIVRQLLDAGRLAASTEATRGVEVRPIGDSAIRVARARLGQRVTLVNLVPDGLHVSGQESVLVQVLVNLVVNAVQALPEHRSDGRVVLRAEQQGQQVSLVVEDNGPGMEPEVLRRVFEPFFTTKAFGSGTGLGLAVSRGLITGLGGDLRLESQPGVGTRAIVELRRGEAPPPPAAPRPQLRVVGIRRKVLLVDDEPTVRSSVRRLLEQRYLVEVAGGVEEGLAQLEADDGFDLVLCDVMMPAGGGERLYLTLLGRRPSVARRIVFLTGGAVTDGARRFLGGQPQPVLHKPLDLMELARVEETVSRDASRLH